MNQLWEEKATAQRPRAARRQPVYLTWCKEYPTQLSTFLNYIIYIHKGDGQLILKNQTFPAPTLPGVP